jgi:hypothetical protein
MVTWRALHDAMREVESIAGTVRDAQARAIMEGNPIMNEEITAQNFSARCALRRVWAVVELREAALQVALAASVKPPGPIVSSLRWNEDVATWASCVTRHLRFPVCMGLLGPGRIPR